MDKPNLLPHSWKKIGWVLFILSTLLGILLLSDWITLSFWDDFPVFAIKSDGIFEGSVFFGMTKNDISDEIVALLIISGGLIVAFSAEKLEDEWIREIRLKSMSKAVVFNYLILVFCIIFFYGTSFYMVMIINMFSTLYFYIISFHLNLRLANSKVDKELIREDVQ